MNRRRLLAAAGAATGATFVAGCLTGSSGDDEPQSTETPPSTPAGSLETACPEYNRVDRVVCYDEIDPESAEGYLEPDPRRVTADESIEFTLYNRSDQTLQTNFYNWLVHKRVDGEWYHVAPTFHNDDCHGLRPGATERWSLRAFNGDAVPCGHDDHGHDSLTQGHLGGGEYAVVAGYGHPADESAALFELVGDRATLKPTDDATIRRDGDTAIVTTDRYGDGEHPPDATFAVARTDAADERVIAEQVMESGRFGGGGRGLRNALAAMTPDVGRVVLRTDEYAFGSDLREPGATRRIRFRGQAYEITREDSES